MLHPDLRRRLVRPFLSAAVALLAGAAAAQTPLLQPHGDHANDQFGAAICVTDDLDGDGVPDVLIGAPSPQGSASAPGYARVVSGADGHLLMRLDTDLPLDLFGASVAASTDGDGDGLRDLIVGCPASGPGAAVPHVIVHHSSTGLPALTFLSTGEEWTALGHAVADLGDVDLDGDSNGAMAAPSPSGELPGTVYVFDTTFLIDAINGSSPGDEFGFAIAGAGDVNLDGVPDILVGAPGGGYARVASGTDGTALLTLPGAGGGFGSSVSAAGDIDGDGVPDLAVGAPGFNRIDVLSGADGELLRRFDEDEGDFGRSIAPLGDVNQDNVPDLLVGAPLDTVLDAAEAGTALVVSGATGQNLFKLTGHSAGARLGTAAAAGDLDGDGRLEMLLGAPGDQLADGTAAGSAGVYDGKLAGSIVSVGVGCPSAFLVTPKLECFGDPLPGGELTVSITESIGGAQAVLMLGLGTQQMPLSNGCVVWINPLAVSVGFVFEGDSFTEATQTFTGRLPDDTPVGMQFGMQALILGFDFLEGVSGTSAVVVTVQ